MLLGAAIGMRTPQAAAQLFEPGYWRARGALAAADRGRGSTWFLGEDADQWVLKHFRRGGWIASMRTLDRYLWRGEARVRAFAEFRLLAALARRGLPVPEAIGARYERTWFSYRCDLITRRIAGARPLSDALAAAALPLARWTEIGGTLRRFHREGADHADLNAHNILIGEGRGVHLIDFDRGRVAAPGRWCGRNLRRLRRSLDKVSAGLPAGRFGGRRLGRPDARLRIRTER